jgi:hypothetical protein
MSVIISEQLPDADRKKEGQPEMPRYNRRPGVRTTKVLVELELGEPLKGAEEVEEEVGDLKRHLESELEYLNWQNKEFIDTNQSGWRIRSFTPI